MFLYEDITGFNSRDPAGRDDAASIRQKIGHRFNSRDPAGRDDDYVAAVQKRGKFQLTRPCGSRLHYDLTAFYLPFRLSFR